MEFPAGAKCGTPGQGPRFGGALGFVLGEGEGTSYGGPGQSSRRASTRTTVSRHLAWMSPSGALRSAPRTRRAGRPPRGGGPVCGTASSPPWCRPAKNPAPVVRRVEGQPPAGAQRVHRLATDPVLPTHVEDVHPVGVTGHPALALGRGTRGTFGRHAGTPSVGAPSWGTPTYMVPGVSRAVVRLTAVS